MQGGPTYRQPSTTGLLPFAKEFVPEVDLEDNCMEVTPPAGWLDMYLAPAVVKERKQWRRGRRRQRSGGATTEE